MTVTVESILTTLRTQPTTINQLTEEEREFMRQLFNAENGWTPEQAALLNAWYLLVPEVGGMDAIATFNANSPGIQIAPMQAEEGWVLPSYLLSDDENFPHDPGMESDPRFLPLWDWMLIENPTFPPPEEPVI